MDNLDLLTERNDQVKMFCYSFFFWSVLFGVLNEKLRYPNILRRFQVDINNRLISILHGQIALWLSLILLISQQPLYTQKNNQQISFIMIVSAGYFGYDLIVCLYYNLYDFWLILHHFGSIVALAMAVQNQYSGTAAITALLYAEIPNLPMHLRLIIKDAGLRHTKLYEVIELTYFFLFVIFRGAFSLPLLISVWKDINTSSIIKLFGSILGIQAILYMVEIKKILKRKMMQYQERLKKKIYYQWVSINPKLDFLSYPKYERKDPIL